jgi:hypothetical protein
VLISALSFSLAQAAMAQGTGADESEQGGGGPPGEPGEDGADSADGTSGTTGSPSKGADGFSSKGASSLGSDADEASEEEPETPRVTRRSPSRNRAVLNPAPVQRPTADLIPGQAPQPISSGPAETLVATQPQPSVNVESTGRDQTLAWLLVLAGGLLAVVLIVGVLRGVGKPGRRSLRDATA